MAKIIINGAEIDIDTKTTIGCAKGKNLIQEHLDQLEGRKQVLVSSLSGKITSGVRISFQESKQQREELKEVEEEILYFQERLAELDQEFAELLEKEDTDTAQALIDQADKRAAVLAEMALDIIPRYSRQLALMAALLKQESEERGRIQERAKESGIENYRVRSPMSRILGNGISQWSDSWWKNLRLPLLDEDMDVLSYWPLPSPYTSKGIQDNPEIREQVESILAADDLKKSMKTVCRELDKMDVTVRAKNKDQQRMKSVYRPQWYERPRSEWQSLFSGNSITEALNNLGDPVEFWLELEEQRRWDSFIHLLTPAQRERALERLPEHECQQYRDHLKTYLDQPPASEPKSRLEKFKTPSSPHDDSGEVFAGSSG